MRPSPLLILLSLLALALAACGTPQGTANDAASAQRYLPNISGYTASDTNSITAAITAVGGGGALASGNVPLAAAIARAESVLQCLQNTGTVGARVYVESPASSIVPEGGAVVIINQDRMNQNLLACLVSGAQAQSAQANLIEVCANSGSFSAEGSSFNYIYVGAGPRLCGFFAQHFSNLGGR